MRGSCAGVNARRSETHHKERMANKQPLEPLFKDLDGFIQEEEYQKVTKTCDKSMHFLLASQFALFILTTHHNLNTSYIIMRREGKKR